MEMDSVNDGHIKHRTEVAQHQHTLVTLLVDIYKNLSCLVIQRSVALFCVITRPIFPKAKFHKRLNKTIKKFHNAAPLKSKEKSKTD